MQRDADSRGEEVPHTWMLPARPCVEVLTGSRPHDLGAVLFRQLILLYSSQNFYSEHTWLQANRRVIWTVSAQHLRFRLNCGHRPGPLRESQE